MDVQQFWRRRGLINILLLPASALFIAGATLRRFCYRLGILPMYGCGAFVVVVGNIVAGGGGKTPVVIALVKALQKRGLRPGVVSRGYGGTETAPTLVEENDNWQRCGDEPLLIRQQTNAPVCVGRKRAAAARKLAQAGCEVIISDDGLQHYAMRRQMEICVVSEDYQFGNGWRLPAGPLREGQQRAADCDVVLVVGGKDAAVSGAVGAINADNAVGATNAVGAAVEVVGIYPLSAPQHIRTVADLSGKKIAAIAGIARPAAFFAMLNTLGVVLSETRALPDHGRLSDADLASIHADVILMTEKDAVKYPHDDERLHALAIRCQLPEDIPTTIMRKIEEGAARASAAGEGAGA